MGRVLILISIILLLTSCQSSEVKEWSTDDIKSAAIIICSYESCRYTREQLAPYFSVNMQNRILSHYMPPLNLGNGSQEANYVGLWGVEDNTELRDDLVITGIEKSPGMFSFIYTYNSMPELPAVNIDVTLNKQGLIDDYEF